MECKKDIFLNFTRRLYWTMTKGVLNVSRKISRKISLRKRNVKVQTREQEVTEESVRGKVKHFFGSRILEGA